MKKILGVIGSPRKLGNSEIMIKEIARNVGEPHELNLLRLADFNLLPCKGCYTCLNEKTPCPLNDDLYKVIEAFCAADAVIAAAPTYCLAANAGLKRFIDRGLSFYAHIDRLWGKPSVGVCIAGIPGKEGHGLLGVENFLKLSMTDIKSTRVVYGALPGEIFLTAENRSTAAELGKALFAPKASSEPHRCPVCLGDTFRFLGGDAVRCMLCSNQGTLNMETGSPVFQITQDGHDFSLRKEDFLRHKEWLIGMKSRFMALKGELKAVNLAYRQDGNWITPE